MFCPKCGKINPDDGVLCNGCNAQLHEEKGKEPKKRFGTILTAIIVAIAIAVSCFIIVSVSGCTDSNPDGDDFEIVQF